MEQWESVIIKWVNCLKLSAPLTSLSHLKDGLFLGNLLKLFPKFLLPTIIHFLKKQYPNFILDCNNYTDLQELEQNDLIMISSLLLHFSCIHDRRDVLTSPLCDQLSKATQTCIKFYLENVGNDINKEKLCQIIGESINIQKIQCKPYILSSGYLFQDSSLQQLLNTPVLKSRYRDKDKEINKLRAEIDLERYEKFELQDTLAIQKECNRKLSQQVSSKAAEITKLRTELTELESKIFSDSPNHTWNELQQRYQKEISNLEQYISQLQTEQDLLQNEKEQISNKVTKLQTEYLLSQERVILSENSYEQLLEKQKQQEDELENLHIHCSELSNLLEELRSNKISSDSCVELDTSSVDVNNKTLERSENLACHVVEVQLRDALQENMNVKSLLKQSQADVLELSSRIEEISASNQQLNTEKKELLLKVTFLKLISKVQKENVLRSSSNLMADVKVKDEDLKKKNTILKQRLTLSENAKSNLEKKVKQLRQENKILNDKGNDAVMEKSCKQLLQQQITQKEEYERKLSESCEKFKKLHQEYLDYKANHNIIPDQMKFNKESKTEQDVKSEKEIMILRDAYGNLMSQNSKLELENATMRKVLEDRTAQLSDVRLVKEAYEKLLEENNTLRMDLDTLKYKRAKDREALFEAISKDKNENKKIQDVRIEYEAKLERMKEKMVQLYKEEMGKETQKLRSENVILFKKNKQLNEILLETKMGMRSARGGDRDTLDSELYFSSESFFGVSDELQSTALNSNHKSTDDPIHTRNFITTRRPIDDRKCATLPKASALNVIQEKKECKSNTLQAVQPRLGQNLEMEDEEEDLFNNKYLADLKSGKCLLPSERESNASRLSELKWRNSLCPPHLKSCYPAETQFNSPTQFKENELKLGLCEFDDSMSTKLLPGEKPRKKDIGTTSYKKPGPPTPSKNGGRVSLQGGEIQSREALRDHNEQPKTPKRNTPSRLKSLFKGRNTSTKDNSETQHGTPRSKRLSIFRKQK
ncbi:hypothetical protein RI129_000702 [Pyrocoelia pectoralis]|uniref:Uncharacterized protein n=1 Tax=Pyrocoelia pectoralis TaxID=417401 RepID=A0AAN7ZWA1_9COLE